MSTKATKSKCLKSTKVDRGRCRRSPSRPSPSIKQRNVCETYARVINLRPPLTAVQFVVGQVQLVRNGFELGALLH